MPSFPYTNGVPNPPSAPSTNVSQMQTNTNSISGLIAIDHVGFGINPNGGTHNQSTYNAGGNPITSATQGAVYTKTVGSDIELFYIHKSSLTPVQLTANLLPIANTPGYTFLPGGMIMQWGFLAIAGTSTAVTFPVTFNNLFMVIAQPYANAAGKFLSVTYGTDGGTGAGFNFLMPSNPLSIANFQWVAIGN